MISLLLFALVAVKPRPFPAMGMRVMHTAARLFSSKLSKIKAAEKYSWSAIIVVATKYSFIPSGERGGLSSEHNDIHTSSSLRPRWDEVPK